MTAQRVITLSNAMLINIIQRTDLHAVLPQLRGVAEQLRKEGAGGCRCRSNTTARRDKVINDFKTMLVGWSNSDKLNLKKMLNASEIGVVVGTRLIKF